MDTQKMKQMFQEIEEMIGSSLGSYLRHGGRNAQELNRIFEDEFTCSKLEQVQRVLEVYLGANKQMVDNMDPDFKDQYSQIVALQKALNITIENLEFQISNLPTLLESIVQSQIQTILNCYKTNHTHDYPNMKESLRLLKEKGFQETDENKLKFTEIYLKSYFRKVVATNLQTGAYRKYKVAVINRFQERYEEMLAG